MSVPSLQQRDLLADIVRAELGSDSRYAGWVPDASVPVVVADDVVAWCDAQDSGGKSMTTHAASLLDGPLAMAPLPYPTVWVEATHPDPSAPGQIGYRTGALVVGAPGKDETGERTLRVSVAGFVLNRNGLQYPQFSLEYRQDVDGTINAFTRREETLTDSSLQWSMGYTPWSSVALRASQTQGVVHIEEHDAQATMAVCHTLWVCATFAFAICKNLKLEEVQVPAKLARKRARNLGLREVRDSFSRLRLLGYQAWSSKARLAAGAGAQELPGHLVRAHPKTYTRNPDGNGGLGRHHAEGTWLWSPQYRGDRQFGTRTVRATVTPPSDPPAAL